MGLRAASQCERRWEIFLRAYRWPEPVLPHALEHADLLERREILVHQSIRNRAILSGRRGAYFMGLTLTVRQVKHFVRVFFAGSPESLVPKKLWRGYAGAFRVLREIVVAEYSERPFRLWFSLIDQCAFGESFLRTITFGTSFCNHTKQRLTCKRFRRIGRSSLIRDALTCIDAPIIRLQIPCACGGLMLARFYAGRNSGD